MKTLQQWLRDFEAEELADLFFQLHPIQLSEVEDSEKTLWEIRNDARELLLHHINSIAQAKPAANPAKGESYVFFAGKMFRDGFSNIEAELCLVNEILHKDEPTNYSDRMMKPEKLAACLIADTDLTMSNLDALLCNILYENSFYGCCPEEMEENDQRMAAARQEHGSSFFDLSGDLWEEFGIQPSEEEKEAAALEQQVYAAMEAHHRHHFLKEVGKVRQLLLEEGNL